MNKLHIFSIFNKKYLFLPIFYCNIYLHSLCNLCNIVKNVENNAIITNLWNENF